MPGLVEHEINLRRKRSLNKEYRFTGKLCFRYRDHEDVKRNAKLKRKKVMKRRAHTDVSASHPGCLSVVRLAYVFSDIFFPSFSIFS